MDSELNPTAGNMAREIYNFFLESSQSREGINILTEMCLENQQI